MSHYKTYLNYKQSGVGWLGEVPDHWKILPVCSLFKRGKSLGHESEELLSVYRDFGVVIKSSRDDNNNKASEDLSLYQLVKPSNLVTNKMKTWQGSIAISPYRGIVSPAYFVYQNNHNELDAYLHHLLRSLPYVTGYMSASKGIRVNQWDLDPDLFRYFPVLVPPKNEQLIIAKHIDDETTRIDSLVSKKTRFIDLLHEKKQALITQAVTEGLDPNVKMKDSGVEWLGQVPTHWDVLPIKHIVATPITDGPHETPNFVDEGIPFVSAEAISSGQINFEKIRGYITEEAHRQYSQKYYPQRGDIFMIKSGATTGITAMVETDINFNIWSPLAVIRCGVRSVPRFVLNYMRSRSFQDAIELNWSYGTQQNIGMGVIGDLAITVPPVEEQIEIALRIDSQIARLDTLINRTERSIELLKERRSALITAAVTGQIDLREAA